MTLASNQAFFNESNERNRLSQKRKILCAFMNGRPMSIRMVSKEVGLTYHQVQKRLDELVSENQIKPYGRTTEKGNNNSMWIINNNPFGEKRPTKTQLLFKIIQEQCPELYDQIKEQYKTQLKQIKGL